MDSTPSITFAILRSGTDFNLGWLGARDGRPTIPVNIKHFRYVGNYRSYADDVKVAETDIEPGGEVLVCNIAATYQGHLIVDGGGLVMHSPIHLGEAGKAVDGPRRASRERIDEVY